MNILIYHLLWYTGTCISAKEWNLVTTVCTFILVLNIQLSAKFKLMHEFLVALYSHQHFLLVLFTVATLVVGYVFCQP